MGTMKTMAKKVARKAGRPSKSIKATVNRAGGVAFDIDNPSVKLITMTGGSFFNEPRYYDADACIPKRLDSGKLGKLLERVKVNKSKAKSGVCSLNVETCDQLDEVSLEIIASLWDILNGENGAEPRDALAIAHWLRKEMNIRLTPQVILTLASHHQNAQQFVRHYTPKIVVRPDEVKTVIMLHRFFFGMKSLKNCLAQGLSDAVARFGERGLLKYEGSGWPQWKDVLLTLPRKGGRPLSKPVAEYFMFGKVSDETPIAKARKELTSLKTFGPKAKTLISESMANWEVVLSQFGQTKESKKDVWEYLVQEDLVGYMAMIRNLRNMLEAGVDKKTIDIVYAKLSDVEQVKNSKQLPFRFLSAADSIRGIYNVNGGHVNKLIEAVENAADVACENVAAFPGLTCVFADNSGSMSTGVSGNSKISAAMAANVLAGIIGRRADEARVCAFGTDVAEVNFTKRTQVLDFVEKIRVANTNGCSTNTHRCVQWMERNNLKPDRVIVLSDMQCWNSGGYYSDGNFADAWKRFSRSNKDCWLHSVNLCGYGDSMTEAQTAKDKVNLIGGFSEKVLNMLLVTEGRVESGVIPTLDQIREQW